MLEELVSRLPGLRRLQLRLAGLPTQLGEINLAPLHDLSCLHELDEAAATPPHQRALTLHALIERANHSPERTLAALGAAELLQWMAPELSPEWQADAQAELGRLLAATGEVPQGLALLQEAALRLGASSRAAWYLVQSLRLVVNPNERRRYLYQFLQMDSPSFDDEIRLACKIEGWWHALTTSDPHTAAGVRYQLEGLLQEPSLSDALRGRALHCLGHALSRQTSSLLLETAAVRLREAIERYRAAADPPGLVRGLDTLGRVLTRLGQHEEAIRVIHESLQAKQHLRDLWGITATINGLAYQRFAQGRPLASADLLQANLVLLPLLDAPASFVKQNQAQLVVALLTDAFPLEETAIIVGPRLGSACLEFSHPPCTENDEALAWCYNAARRWLEARRIPDPGARRERLMPAVRLLRESLNRLQPGLVYDERPRIALYLALALLDRAAVVAGGESAQHFLDQAHAHLEQADQWSQDLLLRPYLEWGFAQWATAARRFDDRQAHLASARHYAELTGNVLFQGLVDDSLNAHLASPLRDCPAPLVLAPGDRLEIPLQLTDWRHRRLPRFSLRVRGPAGVTPFRLETDHLRTNESGQARVVIHAVADGAGTAEFEIRTRAGRPLTTVALQVRELEIDGWEGSAEDRFVLRQLFGPGYQRLLIRRAFEGGLSGTQVLLVHPQMLPTTGSAAVWNGQPCIVKLGAVGPLTSEWQRYRRWVQELLPANVTRMTRFVAWEHRAGILMSLVGTGWSRSRTEHEWLLDASPFDAHYLLEQIFHRDLGLSWYTNTGTDSPAGPLLDAYAWAIPPVWTIEDTHPPGGLLAEPPHAGVPRLDLLTGLHSANAASPPQEIAVDALTLHEVQPTPAGWEYELTAPSGLRVCFRTPLGVDVSESSPGLRWSIRGRPVLPLVVRLRRNLTDCCATRAALHPDEPAPVYEPEAGRLLLPMGSERVALPDPLADLGAMFSRPAPWYGSVIHGDLHGRNVLVDAQGQPYYIDFGKTRYGPTLFDFIKHEQYLWHDLFARRVEVPLGRVIAWMLPLLGRLWETAHHLHGHTIDAPGTFPDWLPAFEQCLQTLRGLARAYTRGPAAIDFHGPFAGLAALMLRWCAPADAPADQRPTLARQGLLQAALAAWTRQRLAV